MLQSIHKFARMACVAAARLFDCTSERLRGDAVVVVHGGRIVGVSSEATIPPEARTIDLGDATLPPVLSTSGCTRACAKHECESFQ